MRCIEWLLFMHAHLGTHLFAEEAVVDSAVALGLSLTRNCSWPVAMLDCNAAARAPMASC